MDFINRTGLIHLHRFAYFVSLAVIFRWIIYFFSITSFPHDAQQ